MSTIFVEAIKWENAQMKHTLTHRSRKRGVGAGGPLAPPMLGLGGLAPPISSLKQGHLTSCASRLGSVRLIVKMVQNKKSCKFLAMFVSDSPYQVSWTSRVQWKNACLTGQYPALAPPIPKTFLLHCYRIIMNVDAYIMILRGNPWLTRSACNWENNHNNHFCCALTKVVTCWDHPSVPYPLWIFCILRRVKKAQSVLLSWVTLRTHIP